MKILSNKKYNDLISKQFRRIFADVNDDNLLRENGLLYGESKELHEEIERLNNIINELEKLLEKEQDRLARETSNIYEDSLGKIRLVNENIYEEVQKIKDKLQELKGSDKE